MKIKTTLNCDIVSLTVKPYKDAGNTKVANLKICVKVGEDDCKAKFGQPFYETAFGPMRINEGLASFNYTNLTPDTVTEGHILKLLDTEIKVVPEVKNISPVKDEPRVVIDMLLPVLVEESKAEFLGKLANEVGNMLKLKFAPQQQELPGTDGPEIIKKKGRYGNDTPVVIQ